MSSIVRNIILSAVLAALILSAARGIAALPQVMHGAGVVAPHTWEELILETLEASGQ